VDQILSLCTGIGGLDLGLHAGLRAVGRKPRTVCMVEREAFAVAILGKAIAEGRMDEAPVWLGDLRELPSHELPRVDWITGGYPCQPFSHAGKRLGEDDPRHLWPIILELIRTLRPRGVFFENVAGHMSLGLDRVLQDLASCGFRSAFGLFTAEEVGAPHRRERVFILGLADPGLHDATARGKCEDASEGRRSWDAEGGSRCDPRQGHCEAAGKAPSMADASSVNGWTGSGEPIDWEEPTERGRVLADADGRGFSERSECDSQSNEGGTSLRDDTHRRDSDMADANGSRSQGRRRDGERTYQWPSRPGCAQGPDEPPRTTQSGLGRNADGLPDRVDRLRALGNAVVSQQAERAFVTLWKELAC
jgi:DNA (cytosine-5)-methyltransferase 1